jgi:hypothetical protein
MVNGVESLPVIVLRVAGTIRKQPVPIYIYQKVGC